MTKIYGGHVFYASESFTNCISFIKQSRVTLPLTEKLNQVATGWAADARWEGSDPSSSFSDKAGGGRCRWCFRWPGSRGELSYFWPTGPWRTSKASRAPSSVSPCGREAITQRLIGGTESQDEPICFYKITSDSGSTAHTAACASYRISRQERAVMAAPLDSLPAH